MSATTTDIVRTEQLRFVNEYGLVRTLTLRPGREWAMLSIDGLSGFLHNHIMLRGDVDDHNEFLDGPRFGLPYVVRLDGTIVDPQVDDVWDDDIEGAITNLLVERIRENP